MSRWIQQFENHAFQPFWKKIIEETVNISVDDETVVTSVEEIARFKKIVTYLNSLLKACDPELIPSSTWENFTLNPLNAQNK